jgi:hypothetical protein
MTEELESHTLPLEAALAYRRRRWSPLPVPFRSKKCLLEGWPKLRLTEETIPQYFNGQPQNISILIGEPSDWIVDVDLDHPRCVALADQFLPPTPAIFGRPSKPRSHREYHVSAPVASKTFKSKSAGMLVELRSTGLQTVFPPSTHECGEPITWETDGAEPAVVDPEVLLAALERLATAVRVELGERAAPKAPKSPAPKSAAGGRPARAKSAGTVAACVDAMLRMNMVDHHDGSGRLFAAACRVVEHDLSDADGVAAICEYARQKPFPREWNDKELLDRIHDAENKTQRGVIRRAPSSDGKPNVLIDTEEHRVVCETISALAADTEIFQRGNILVRVLRDEQLQDGITRCNGSAVITRLPMASLRERMTKFATFTQFTRRGDVVAEVAAHPTPWLVGAIDARGDWPGIRHLSAVSDVPILRADGTLWQTAGYDPKTGVLFDPCGSFPLIPDGVALDDADVALTALMEIVHDFRFENDDHRAAWLAGLLTPLARFAFDGPSPLFLIDANVRGAGKGLLAQTIGQVVLGREMPVSSYSHDSEEMRKKITAIALAGDRMVHLDNLEGSFGNDTLDRALTTTRWKDRILGKSEQVDLPLIPVWYGTGNNVAVAADTTRRIIHIRLDVMNEHPEDRTDFKHPDLIGWLRQERPRLLTSALTILAAYFNAGRQTHNLTPFGSFEGWSRLVREAVVWVGLPDPCRTRTRLVELADTTIGGLAQLMQAWHAYDGSNEGVVVSDLLALLYRKDFHPTDAASVAMRAALENLVGCAPGKIPAPRQVGNKIKSFRRRVVEGHYLDTNPNEHHRNGAVWRLCATKEGETNV